MIYQLKKHIKRFVKSIKFSHIKKQIDCDSQWYGNDYGGFFVNPKMLGNDAVVYSLGIGKDISFDKAIIANHQCSVFGFDPTPKSIDWCSSQQLPENFYFYPFGIAQNSGFVKFNLPKISNHISGSVVNHSDVNNENFVEVEMKSFSDILRQLKHSKIDVLKMDIEGSEYEVMESILANDLDIHQILIEFHERFFENGKEKSIQCINMMNKKGYKIFAISDSYEEISFVKEKALLD